VIVDHDRCEWVNVSSGTGSPRLSQTKSRESLNGCCSSCCCYKVNMCLSICLVYKHVRLKTFNAHNSYKALLEMCVCVGVKSWWNGLNIWLAVVMLHIYRLALYCDVLTLPWACCSPEMCLCHHQCKHVDQSPVFCDSECNCRSVITLAMRHLILLYPTEFSGFWWRRASCLCSAEAWHPLLGDHRKKFTITQRVYKYMPNLMENSRRLFAKFMEILWALYWLFKLLTDKMFSSFNT